MRRKSLIILFLCISLLGGAYWYFFIRNVSASTTQNILTRVVSSSISSSVKTTGKISPVQTSVLSLTRQGTVTKIYKNIDDPVKSGDIIVEIDASDAYMDIRNAKIALDNANNNYNKLFSTTTEADRIRTKNSLEESMNSLNLLEAEYEDFLVSQRNTLLESEAQIGLLKDKVKLAESDLEYTKKNLDTTTDASNLERDMANAFLAVEESNRIIPDNLRSIRDLIYIVNKNSDRYGDLGSKNEYQKMQTEQLYMSVSGSVYVFSEELSLLRGKKDKTLDDIIRIVNQSQALLQDMIRLSALGVEEYENTPAKEALSQGDIDTAKTSLRTLGSTLSTKLTSLNNTYTTLKTYGSDYIQALADQNTIIAKEQSLQIAKNDLKKAERVYEALKTSQNTDLISRKNEISKMKNAIILSDATYDELLRGPSETDVRSAKNSITTAEINLSKANIALKEYQIVAGFDGVVNDIPWKVGDLTKSTEGILVENTDAYEITLSLDQIDIVKIQEGMKANIILDAFPAETYIGKVSRVSAVPTETSGVVSYEAIVELSVDRDDIYTKMSATVEIITKEKNDILVVPTSAITNEGGKSYVNKVIDPSIYSRLMSANRPNGSSGGTRSFSEEGRGGVSGNRDMFGSGRSFSGETRGSGSLFGSGRSFSGETRGSGSLFGSGRSFSGNLAGSGNTRGNNPSGRLRSGSTSGISTTESVPTEKTEVTLGLSSDGKTEILSGLSLGDVILTTSKIGNSVRSTTNSSNTTTRIPGAGGGFGGGRPPGF